jgi:hypothetical protein
VGDEDFEVDEEDELAREIAESGAITLNKAIEEADLDGRLESLSTEDVSVAKVLITKVRHIPWVYVVFLPCLVLDGIVIVFPFSFRTSHVRAHFYYAFIANHSILVYKVRLSFFLNLSLLSTTTI